MWTGRLTSLALVIWHATLQTFAGTSEMLQIKYMISGTPSGVYWLPSNSKEVSAISELHCAMLAHASGAIGYTYFDRKCVMIGVNSSGRSFGVANLISVWSVNRAFKRPTWGSGTAYPSSPLTNAVDEKTCLAWSPSNTACCHVTYTVNNGWLLIDLGAPLKVFGVIVGTVLCIGMEVRVGSELQKGDFQSYELVGEAHHRRRSACYIKYTKYPAILGRYVSLQQRGEVNLYVCDVIVLADD